MPLNLDEFVAQVRELQECNERLQEENAELLSSYISMKLQCRDQAEQMSTALECSMSDVCILMDSNERLEAENTYYEMELDRMRCNGVSEMRELLDGNTKVLENFEDLHLQTFMHFGKCIYDACAMRLQYNQHQQIQRAQIEQQIVVAAQLEDAQLEKMRLEHEKQSAQRELEVVHERLRETEKALDDRARCTICTIAVVDVVTHPCNHMCMCMECYHALEAKSSGKKKAPCPICRRLVTKVTKVFIA
tara:strand:+ start:457 stop:1200 length:744 start_codon:yes stop_codon:yes gene_type:complete